MAKRKYTVNLEHCAWYEITVEAENIYDAIDEAEKQVCDVDLYDGATRCVGVREED